MTHVCVPLWQRVAVYLMANTASIQYSLMEAQAVRHRHRRSRKGRGSFYCGVASTPALVAIAVAASHACTHHQSWSWPACTSIGRSLAATRTSGRNKEAATHFPCEETKQTPINVQLTPSSLLLVVARKKRRDAARELASISSIHCIEGSCSAALYYCAAALLVVVLFGK